MRMLYAVGFNYFDLVADLNGKVHTINRIALFDLLQHTRIPGGECCRFVKTFLYRSKETILLV